MSDNLKGTTREEFEKAIIQKALKDESFKKALMGNPKEVLEEIGVQVPAEVDIKVVEESTKVVYLVLPTHLDELTDEQLDEVAGGLYCNDCWCYQVFLEWVKKNILV